MKTSVQKKSSNYLLLLLLAAFSFAGEAQISAGGRHTLVVCNDHSVMDFGSNGSGLLGTGTTSSYITAAQQVMNLSGIIGVAGGNNFSLFLKNDGTVWGCGSNSYGQLGDGTTSQHTLAIQIAGVSGITAIATGWNHSLFLKNDGTVWACGYNNLGQLGDGTTANKLSAIQVPGLSGITAIAGGAAHSLFLKNDGTVWACGENFYGELCRGTMNFTANPNVAQCAGLSSISAIAAGFSHSVFLKNDGTVWASGDNSAYELGDGTSNNSAVAVQVAGLSGITAIAAANGSHNLYLKNDGTVWACGVNTYGDLGTGNTTQTTTAVQVSGISNVVGIATGGDHSVFLKNDGTVWTCGYNLDGELGDGTTTHRHTPVQATGLCPAAAGIHENSMENNITIYPNPSAQNITVDAPGLLVKNIIIYDFSGKQVYQCNEKSTADVSKLNDGIYTICIMTAQGVISKRISVVH